MRDRFELDPDDVFADARASTSTPRGCARRERVECEIFLRDETNVDAADDASVDDACAFVNATIADITAGHVWQREAFVVEPEPARGGNRRRRRLRGGVSFGDCVDDCWYVAHIAREISVRHASIVLAARVWDDDGEFLLIETAETLPRWVTPERATGTTFLRNGELVVVDADSTREDDRDATTRALERVETTRALGPMTQKVLNDKLDACPARALANRHDAYAVVPASVARVLRREPQLIAFAIESFRARDPAGLRAAAEMVTFPPKDFHPTAVRMSRRLYAQVTGERFEPPKCYRLPPKTSEEFDAFELGMKIACGLEMLVAERRRDEETEDGAAREPTRDDAWRTFKASLVANGYFRDEMEGSALYKTLLAKAVREFKGSSLAKEARRLVDAPARRVLEILAVPVEEDDELPMATPADASDDAWLLDAEKELNEELAKLESRRDGVVADAAKSARTFVERRESGFEGAETRRDHNSTPGSCPGDLNIPDGDDVFKLNARGFLSELGKALGVTDDEKFRAFMDADAEIGDDFDFGVDQGFDSQSDDNYFDSDSDDRGLPEDDFFASSGSEDAGEPAAAPRRGAAAFVHVCDGLPDSDDDDDDDDDVDDDEFNRHYDAVLRDQLASSKIDVITPVPSADADVSAALARGLLAGASASDGADGPAVSLLAAAGVDATRIRDIARMDVSDVDS